MILPGPGSRGQSDVLGVALLLGLVVAGVAVIGAVGGAAVTDTQDQVGVERAVNAMTLFDSRAALVALGDADRQSVRFGADSGDFDIRPDAGQLTITHHNYSGDDNVETIYNASLGSLVYESGGTEIAYQGGGVWQRDVNGGGHLLSPPEFHYRGATLTLPIVRLSDGDAQGGGNSQVVVTPLDRARHVFPNASASSDGSPEVGAPYDPNDDGAELAYGNPIRNGTVTITVQSRYYLGWTEYFNQRTAGDIEVFKHNNSVRLTLETVSGSIGSFEMPEEGNPLEIRGIGSDHSIDEWTMTLKPDPHFQNLHWSMYVDNLNEQFEVHVHSDDKCTGGGFGGTLDVSVYYGSGGTIHEEWQNSSVDPDTNPDFDVDCSSGELRMDLQGSTPLTYDDIDMTGSSNKWHFGPDIKDTDVTADTTTFDAHSADSGQYSPTETESIGFLTDHYVSLLPSSHDLVVTDGPGGSSRVDESASTGELSYATASSAQYLTFLHITENEVEVTLD